MTWNEVLLNVVNTILGLIITVGLPYVFSLVRNMAKVDIQRKYLDRAEHLVEDAVAQVQQTYVSEMKKQNMFDKTAQAIAFGKARDAVLEMMNERTKEIVTEAVGDFEAYLKNLIEAAVHDVKYFEN